MKNRTNPIIIVITALSVLVLISCTGNKTVSFDYDKNQPQLEFAVSKIRVAIESLTDKRMDVDGFTIRLELEENYCEGEGFSIIKAENRDILVKASDVNGLMYGGLELAEQISLFNEISETSKRPFIRKRGIKMNIPLDARTPSYDDTGDAAQKNIIEMWSWEFWEEYLDNLAMNRYNTLTLWNPHPFPSMIKLPEYPDVALDDVCVTTLKPTGKEHEWAEPQMVSSNVVENIEVVKKISIDDKIVFWQKVMQRAKDRGIDIYFFTWNICPNGAALPVEPFYKTYDIELWDEQPGSNGITNQMNNPITIAYYNNAVKTFLLTYPHVKGIGVTAGEHMMDEAGDYTREQWIWEAYGLGILDAKKEQPGRSVDFIHRVWNSNMDKIMEFWKKYPDSFEASFKYARARLYSSPDLNFAEEHIEKMNNYNLKSWWNLRNDDIFVHRWGDPDYVREFIGNFDKEHTAGFYMGSDGYVWGREFVEKRSELSRQLEVEKHWYKFLLWGRLAYDNGLDKDFFLAKLDERYPGTDTELLYSSWQTASRIIPAVNCFHWQNWDYQWAVEACIDLRNGFHKVTDFIDNPTLDGSGIINPGTYARAHVAGETISGITPLSVVQKLREDASKAIDGASNLRKTGNPAELNAILDDITGMSFLGEYYANKIEAATELALFMESSNADHRNNALVLLENAVESWTKYTELSGKNYHPQRLARTGRLDWREILEYVQQDLETIKNTSQY
ncbi:carbohydrate-binding family 6 protein [Bacteroidota bacterium]